MTTRGTIFIIDDQQGIRESMAGVLEIEGFEVHAFGDGPSGIAAAQERRFDLLFLDVKMPGMSGVEVFQEIRKIQPAAAVYMMSALFDDDDLVKEMLSQGACGCIYKPFNMDEVLGIINNHFANPVRDHL
jgi:DNA-binding response OmpR family regulator